MKDSATAWIGRCYLTKGEGAAQIRFEAFAAVFCKGRKDFEERLRSFITPQGLQLDYAEDVLTTVDWLSCFGHNLTVVTLSQSVHDLNRVAMGPVMTMGAIQDDEPEPPKSYLTITEHEIEALPDQSGIPFWDRQWITPKLKDLLFGQPEDKSKLCSYLIVDATLRKNIVGVFDLDSEVIDVPVECLLKGEAAQKLKEVAPYLIDMTLPEDALNDSNLVPEFHKNFIKEHWGKGTGIFIRTTAPMNEILHHFRKFFMLQIEKNSKWVFFRFWDPRILPSYFDSIKKVPEKTAQWINIKNKSQLKGIISDRLNVRHAWSITPDLNALEDIIIKGNPTLSDNEMDCFKNYKIEKFDRETAIALSSTYKYLNCDLVQFQEFTKIVREWANNYRISGERNVTYLVHLAIALGVEFPKDIRFANLSVILSFFEEDADIRVERCISEAKLMLSVIFDDKNNIKSQFKQYIDSLNERCINANESVFSALKKLNNDYINSINENILIDFIKDVYSICDVNNINEFYKKNCFVFCALIYGQNFFYDPLRKNIINVFYEAHSIAKFEAALILLLNNSAEDYLYE